MLYHYFPSKEIEFDRGEIIGEEKRQWVIDRVIEHIQSMQLTGKIPDDLDARFLLLAAHCLTVYPLVFWQVTRMMTGKSPENPEFQAEWSAFLEQLEQRIFRMENLDRSDVDVQAHQHE